MVVYADPLDTYGWGGGSGPDGQPLQSTSDAFKTNMANAAADAVGGSAQWVLRANITIPYTRTGDPKIGPANTFGVWSFAGIDRLIAIVSNAGGNVLLSINVQSPTTSDKVPLITSGVMAGWKTKVAQVFARYAGPSATIKAGSVVTMSDGSHVTIPDDWPGVKFFEVWNEPNQIGSCGGALWQGGSNQGRPWYDLVYILNRDTLEVAEAHPDRDTFELAAITMGGLEPDFLIAGNGRPYGVLDWGKSKGLDWSRFDAVSMHCYQNTDPMTATGAAAYRGRLDTIRTHIRPAMNGAAAGASACDIWIDEGGVGGSLGKGGVTLGSSGGLAEKWNKYKTTYTSIAGVGKSQTDVMWGRLFSDGAHDAAQQAGDLTQPGILKGYVDKCHLLNTANNARIRLLVWHMLIRVEGLTACEASNGSHSGVVGRSCSCSSPCVPLEQGASDYLYWQKARATLELYTADTDPAAYTGSSQWLPGLTALSGAISDYGTFTAPSNTALPTLNNPTPAIGDTLVVDVGAWDGSPAPAFTYQWQRAGVDVAGETGTSYDVTLADLGAALRVVVTGTNGAGSDTATSAATAAVASPDDSPSNTVTPSLSDAQGPLTSSGLGPVNAPDVGSPVTVDLGTWTPDPDLYFVRWQKRDPNTLVITDIVLPLPGEDS